MIQNSITGHIGKTPVTRLTGFLAPHAAEIFIKMEGFNPGGSVKDRPALNMILEAERSGQLRPNGTIVESTSGNLGTALAMIAAARGYRCVIVVDPRTSHQNIAMIKAFGAEIDMVTDMNPRDGTYQEARIKRVKFLAGSISNAYMPWQYGNKNNPLAHVNTTAQEILDDFPNGPDALIASVSTAGQISGIARGLRHQNTKTITCAVDVKGSVVFGGQKGPTAVTGMGLGWVPENLDENVIDEAYQVSTAMCFTASRIVARKFGVLLGGSSGAALTVAVSKAFRLGKGKTVVAICPDRGEKYLDEFYDNDWMQEHKLPTDDNLDIFMRNAAHIRPVRYPATEKQAKMG
jgi:2,3-diaminopropionate biosynthesis protein SbnA